MLCGSRQRPCLLQSQTLSVPRHPPRFIHALSAFKRQRRNPSQPRATPWVTRTKHLRALKGRPQYAHHPYRNPIESPLKGSRFLLPYSQGVALGWDDAPPWGSRQQPDEPLAFLRIKCGAMPSGSRPTFLRCGTARLDPSARSTANATNGRWLDRMLTFNCSLTPVFRRRASGNSGALAMRRSEEVQFNAMTSSSLVRLSQPAFPV
jgi:hypothetical protein